MLLTKEFESYVNTLCLDDYEKEFASMIWAKCERVILGKDKQTPVLLTKPKKESKSMNKQVQTFTREELQFLKSTFQNVLSQIGEEKRANKSDMSILWDGADKDTEVGKLCFERLNMVKSQHRKVRAAEQKLVKIQSKIKRMLNK